MSSFLSGLNGFWTRLKNQADINPQTILTFVTKRQMSLSLISQPFRKISRDAFISSLYGILVSASKQVSRYLISRYIGICICFEGLGP